MSDARSVIETAERLHREKDEAALELLLGMRARAIEQNPSLKEESDFEPKYDSHTMGPLDDIKAIGRRILKRWNKELYGLVCGSETEDRKERRAVLDSLQLGEAAAVAAIAGALLALNAPAALAAVAAPLIVKRFVWPAKDELCAAWGEQIQAQD